MVQRTRYSEWGCRNRLYWVAAGLLALFAGSCATAPHGPRPVDGSVHFYLEVRDAGDVSLVLMDGDDAPRKLLLTPAGERKNRYWATSLKLPPGEYRYFFIVDGIIRVDPEAPRLEEDDFGGLNGVFSVEQSSRGNWRVY